jgi:hypothetical protein
LKSLKLLYITDGGVGKDDNYNHIYDHHSGCDNDDDDDDDDDGNSTWKLNSYYTFCY